jgi:hypothetical protein
MRRWVKVTLDAAGDHHALRVAVPGLEANSDSYLHVGY